MNFTRRNMLMSTLFGAGYVGLRSLATGLPSALLSKGHRAYAAGTGGTCIDAAKAQYWILATSGSGDPIGANAPGTYDDPNITHSPDTVQMAKTPLTVGTTQTFAAAPWATLPSTVLQRTTFWHIMTNTPVHPKEPDVLRLLGATTPNEMLPSLLAKQMAPCLGTVQSQPITLGATSPSEGLSYGGQALPIIPPLALKATLTSPTGPLSGLQSLRDQTMGELDSIYRAHARPAQKRYLDSLLTSQSEFRNIHQDLLGMLSSIKDNSVASQITAAVALIKMNVTPVIAIHIPFGGDNHSDTNLVNETTQTVSGVASIASLMSQLETAGLQDQVSFMSLNVFGRTLGPGNGQGRNHNPNWQMSMTIGKPFKGGIVGGLAPVANDYGAVAIDSASGSASASGDIAPTDSLASFGKTTLAAVGVDSSTIDYVIASGKVVQGALV